MLVYIERDFVRGDFVLQHFRGIRPGKILSRGDYVPDSYLVRRFHRSAIWCSFVGENQRNFLYVVIVPPVAERQDLAKKVLHSSRNVIATHIDYR